MHGLEFHLPGSEGLADWPWTLITAPLVNLLQTEVKDECDFRENFTLD